MKVIKRNGTEDEFQKSKIIAAISKANEDVAMKNPKSSIKDEVIITVVNRLYERCRKRNHPTSVEEIQEMVETELMKERAFEVAKAYVRYRYKRRLARDQYGELMSAITEKIQARNVQNQNANVDEKSFGGRIGEATSLMMKQYALDYCMTEKSKRNHLENRIYIHDLDSYAVGSHNCLSIPFDKLLANGFNTRQTDVRPATSLNTAMQLVAVIFQLQSLQQFGGVSATHIDWTMVPYVRKSFYKHYKDGAKYIDGLDLDYSFSPDMSIDEDDYKAYSYPAYQYAMAMTEKECHQAVEALYHNLNTLQSRSGNQLK